jgi:hypothetical protein
MCIIVVFIIIKTFFFLRIFPTLTPIIVMLKSVVYDLRIFLFFYIILISLFSQLFAILGLGNSYGLVPIKTVEADGTTTTEMQIKDPIVGTEYNAIGLHWGEWMWTLRLSMGDFSAIGPSTGLKGAENWIFWILWLLTVIITCIIFLNFIVAEASASYTKVTESLDEFILIEKAALIFEAESMSLKSSKNNTNYPRFIIKRTIDC